MRIIQLGVKHLLPPRYYVRVFVRAVGSRLFYKTADHEALLCREHDGFEDQEGLFKGGQAL